MVGWAKTVVKHQSELRRSAHKVVPPQYFCLSGSGVGSENPQCSQVVLPLRVQGPHVWPALFPLELYLRDWLGVQWG